MPLLLPESIEPVASLVVDGSLDPSGPATADMLANLGVTLDLDGLVGWRGGSLTAVAQGVAGAPNLSTYKAFQGYTNIDADNQVGAAEIFLAQDFGGKVALRAGRLDGGATFGVTDGGGEFINPSMGVAPTMVGLPTFPAPTWGGEAAVTPVAALSVTGGAYQSDVGVYGIGQAQLSWAPDRHGAGHVEAGAWKAGDGEGVFGVVDQRILGAADGRGLSAYVQGSLAHPLPDGADAHLGGGLVAYGPLASRADDAMGAGVTAAHLPGGSSEIVGEGWYRASLLPQVSVRLDVQGFSGSDGTKGGVAIVRSAFAL